MTKSMDIGIKISVPGHDVNGREITSPPEPSDMAPYMVASMAVAFIYGAQAALRRYVEAANAAKQDVNRIYECIYESSNLIENLDIIDRYMSMCGQATRLPVNIRVVRNHIRHDHRENLNSSDNSARTRRAKTLKLDDRLLIHMGFDPDEIKIGGTMLKIADAIAFIGRADAYFKDVIQEAINAGRINGVDISQS